MKFLFSIILAFLVNCAVAQTQAEMSNAAYASFQKADDDLNVVYKKILNKYKTDTAFITNLKSSQRIWISFRDAELKMKYPEREAGDYGSIHAVCRAAYLEELTLERTNKLKQWLVGVEEGDACSGSIADKE